ncbi:MAG: NAD+ synthase [Pyrobaculum sp.]
MITISDVINSINYSLAKEEIIEFVTSYFSKTRAKAGVVGLSGGVDSSVTLALAAEALGPAKVYALIMPSKFTPSDDVEDALNVARIYNVKYRVVDISPILNVYEASIPDYDRENVVARGNLMARIRMSILYYYANKLNGLVIGTGDKSELYLGYFTKYGDGGVDLLPIGDLFKTQVRRLAAVLGIPERIVTKPSSPRFWFGHTADGELGISYQEVDLILYGYELGLSPSAIARETKIDLQKIRKVLRKIKENQHKRSPPPICKLSRSKTITRGFFQNTDSARYIKP